MAAKSNLTIDQGVTFAKRWTYKAGSPATPVDLTGCTARMQVREKVTSTDVLLELTTENAGIALGGAAGTVLLNITDTDTAAIGWKTGVYDLHLIFPSGFVKKFVRGSVTVEPGVTR